MKKRQLKKKLAAKGLPGSDKILSDFKKTGPKPTAKPIEDKRFNLFTEKKGTKAINSYTNNMKKSKFDVLFESVVQDENLGDLENQLDTDATALGDGVEPGGELPDVEGDLDAVEGEEKDIHALLADLDALVAEIKSKVEALDGGVSDVEGDLDLDVDADVDAELGDVDPDFDEEVVKEEEVDAENLGTPLQNLKKNPLHDADGKKSNKVNAPGVKPASGKAVTGTVPNVAANPTAVGEKTGLSLADKKKNKVDSKVKGGNQTLFNA